MSDSSKTLSIKIMAEDGASKTFQAVATSAKTMGDVFEEIVAEGGGAFDGVAESAATMGDAVESAAQQGSAATQQMVASAREVADAYQTIGQALTVVGGAGTAFFGVSVAEFNTLESAMANVNSIAGLTGGELQALTGQVRDLGTAFAIDPSMLADGLYDIVSSGFEASDALNILEKSAIAARAGLTDTSTAARAISGVLNAYSLSADKAGDVSDVLFKVVDSGVISFESLANNLGATTPLAAQLGVSIEELGAAYAELTLQNISAAQAETSIAALMRSSIVETTAMTEAIQEYGYASAEALISTEGLAGFLEFLAEASGGSSGALIELLGSAEATTAALALMRNDGENFNIMLGEMEGAAQGGARTLDVFSVQTETTAFALQQLGAEFTDFRLTMGEAIAPLVQSGAEIGTAFLGAINSLPGPIQTAIALFGALGSAGALAAGGLLLALPKILEIRAAIQTLGGLQGIVGSLGSRFALLGAAISPLGLTLGAIAVAGGLVIKTFMDQKAAADEYRQSVSTLETTLEMLRRQGDGDLANLGEQLGDQFVEAKSRFEEFKDSVKDDLISGDDPWFLETTLGDVGDASEQAAQAMELATQANQRLNEALNDPNVDADAWIAWADGLITAAESTETLEDDIVALQTILSRPLSDFRRIADDAADGIDGIGQAAAAAAAPVESLTKLFADLPAALDDLRLDGQGQLASDLEAMNKSIEATFVRMQSPEMFGLGSNGAPWIQTLELGEEQVGQLGTAWDRVWQGMESGVLDNTALMADWNAILSDSTLTDEQKVVSLTALSNTLSTYYDSAKAMQEQQVDFLADGANILDWWEQYQVAVNQGGAAMVESQAQVDAFNAALAEQQSFASLVDWAQDINDASAALDQALRTFEQIDSLGQRSASSASIADTLIGAPGELGALQDLWERVSAGTSDAALSQETYNQAITAGVSIQESNLRVQDDLNVVRAMQIPLLAEQQLAYERNIASLTTMTAQEQQHALMLQDSSIQAQIAQQYSLAYSASIGEIPKEVVTEMIANTAQADPAMASILEQMGLIEIGAEGEITVNFPDADATIGAINRMTEAYLYIQAAAENRTVLDLAIELYGEEDAREILGMTEEADGTTSTTTLNVETNVNGVPGGIQAGFQGLLSSLGLGGGDEPAAKLDLEATVSLTPPDVSALEGWAADQNVEVGVIPVWEGSVTGGDGTGGGVGTPELTPIEWPVTPVITGLPESGDGSSMFDGLAQDVEISVTQVGMESVIGLAQATQNAVEGIPTSWTSSITETGAAGVIGLANATANAIESIPTSWRTTISLSGAESAIGSAHAVANAIAAIPTSKTSTINVVTAYSSVGSPVTAQAHGGIPGFAGGGIPDWIPFYGAEGNRPELLHFAGGGTAPIFTEGMYAVPPMTYVSPANANPGLGGGRSITVHVHVQGDVVTREQLRLDIAEAIWAAELEEDMEHLAGMGVHP